MLVLLTGLGLTGCSGYTSTEAMDLAANEPDVYSDSPGPAPAPVPAAVPAPAPAAADLGWSCYYDATYNEDWHDDVLCSNGDEFQRPYLREWDDFVTESEIMESAAEYEAELNAGG